MGIHSCLNTFMYQYPNQAVFTVEGKEFRLDVDAIYSAFRSIKEPFGGKVSYEKNGVEVQCYAAFGGRLLGGYNWTVNCQIDSLFYCPDFSVKPSYILKRVNFPTTISTLFLNTTSLHIQPPLAGVKYEDRLQQLFKTLQQALRSGGDVLVPVDVASRGLEVLSVITHLFKENACDQYKVVLASIQSREIIDKATTMTEVLKNDVMLSEETLFSTVLPCKTAEEVLSIRTPKVCVADGANLDYGIAAELVKPVCQNENSIVLFTSNPKQDTNASNILLNHETMGDFDLRYVRRSRLDREELEEYYRQLEHESELERQRLEMEGAFEVVKEDDDMDLDEDEAGSPKEKKATLVPGLYLPSTSTHPPESSSTFLC
ncbi:hypothetical protein AGDE_06740 [Angomonas deanei]|nr:hypothetical protein AGDE_06740 [Angomonas deanei]|eukprot:EPY36792.1 hypothetical protein AGDE_06740 [Angomonas deanei]